MTQPARPWIVLTATLTIQALVAMALITLPVVAPVVAQATGIASTYVGAYVGLVYLAAMFSSVLGGTAVKRFGAIRLSQGCLMLTATGLILCAVPHPLSMAVGALFIGAGYGPVTPASSHLLIKTTPPERLSLVFSLKQTGVPIGGVLAGLLVPQFELLLGWQWAFLLVGAFCLVCAYSVKPLRAALDEDRDATVRPSLIKSLVNPIKLVWSHKALRILAGVSFLFAITQLSLTTYLVTFLFEDLGWALVAAGAALAVTQAAGVGARIVWGWMADNWFGSGYMLMVVAGLLAISAAAMPFFTPETPHVWLYLVLILLGATAIGWNGVFLAEVARQAPKGQASVATGGTLGFTFFGVLCGPPLFGVAAANLQSYGLSYALLILPAALILALLWTSRHRWRRYCV
uniref:MFS transporter n=1 Tax=Orrella sp. TaxID=1921583 RepID=UPI00404722C6